MILPSNDEIKAMRAQLTLDQFLEIERRLQSISQMCHFLSSWTEAESDVRFAFEGKTHTTTFDQPGGRVAWEAIKSMLFEEYLPGIPEHLESAVRFMLVKMFLAGVRAYDPPAATVLGIGQDQARERARDRFMLAALQQGIRMASR